MTTLPSPNLFEVSGHGVRVTYAQSSFSGAPQFHYQDHAQNRQFSGPEITTETTTIGTLVSVNLSTIPDLRTTTFTLLLPAITLRTAESTPIRTLGFTTLHRQSIIGPPEGQDELYTAVHLSGTARFVVF